jgi:hypothetical protein
MSNAAIYLHPDAFDTAGKALLGRRSAGESFLRGFLRHGDVEAFHFWNVAGEPPAKIEALVERIEPPDDRCGGSARDRPHLRRRRRAYMPGPSLDQRGLPPPGLRSRAYAICGVTHTTATDGHADLPDLLVAPVEGHDALICTSGAVRDAVEAQLSMMRDYLTAEFGPAPRPS